jgi:hypothetical protein
METVSLNKKIEDYVNNRLVDAEKVDFEADMAMDKELEKEVARVILRKMQIERKVKEHIEKVELERISSIQEYKTQSIYDTIREKWGKLLENLSSN